MIIIKICKTIYWQCKNGKKYTKNGAKNNQKSNIWFAAKINFTKIMVAKSDEQIT